MMKKFNGQAQVSAENVRDKLGPKSDWTEKL